MLIKLFFTLFIIITTAGNLANGSCSYMQRAYKHSQHEYQLKKALEQNLIDEGFVVSEGQPGAVFFNDLPLTKELSALYMKSSTLINAEQMYSQIYLSNSSQLPISNEEKISIVRSLSHLIPLQYRCRESTQHCNTSETYRTINGYCNNLEQPFSGSTNSPFTRLAPAVYDDGFHSVRRNTVTRGELVSAMVLSNDLQPPLAAIPVQYTNYGGLTFGQFIAHDLGLRNLIQGEKGGPSIRCCSSDYSRRLPYNLMNVGCYPIDIEESSLFFAQYNNTCMNFVRSQPIFRSDCKLGAAEQANTVTHFMDASNLYGSELGKANELRSSCSGKLKVSKGNFLPKNPHKSIYYYLTGDDRANQHPTIALFSTVFLRLHNRFAEKLAALNPYWDKNKIFEETRRIIIAIYQHISYDEWLPIFIGREYCIEQNIICEERSTYCGNYESYTEPGTSNVFSHGVYRTFHKFLPLTIDLYTENKIKYYSYMLPDLLQKPEVLQESFDGFLYGMFYEPILYDEIRNQSEFQFFNNYNKYGIGMSLFAHDIQRGRDHGLAPYYVYQELCIPGSNKVKNWTDLEVNIDPKDIDQLKTYFDTVFDVDLKSGLTVEISINGYLGKVGKCLVAKQFITTKNTDRFFYSFAESPYPFTRAQLKQINRYFFSNLVCETTDARTVPRKAFVFPSSSNKMVKCKKLSLFNLSPWKE